MVVEVKALLLDQLLEGCEDGTVLQVGFCMSVYVGWSGRGRDKWVNGVCAHVYMERGQLFECVPVCACAYI